jgi:NitT/TauT family transport system substrate-binding protein
LRIANRLSVTVKDYPTGVGTIDALREGEVDIAWAAEFPLVRRALAADKISIIAALSRFSDQYLFARRDCSIGSITDLKGRSIGLPRNTIAEFYLARFLELHGMNTQDVRLVDVQPAQSLELIAGGGLEAVVTWEPYTSRLRTKMAEKVADWPVQSNQPGFGVIVCKNDWIGNHPKTVARLLKSLIGAEDYLIRHPRESKEMVKKRVSYDDAFMEVFWSENQFSVFLDHSLVLAMEDEARWLIRNHLTEASEVPDFLDFIFVDGLRAVKPAAVNIIR